MLKNLDIIIKNIYLCGKILTMQKHTYIIKLKEEEAVKHKEYYLFIYRGVSRYNDVPTLNFYTDIYVDLTEVRRMFELTKGLGDIIYAGVKEVKNGN